MNEYLLQITCKECGCIDEPILNLLGGKVKCSCQYCGNMIGFIEVDELPPLLKVREKIWSIGCKDERFISGCKVTSRFNLISHGVKPLTEAEINYNWIQYWKLYLECRSMINNAKGK